MFYEAWLAIFLRKNRMHPPRLFERQKKEYTQSLESLRKFINLIAEHMKKIKAARMNFAYHNHAFEFEKIDGVKKYDILIEESPVTMESAQYSLRLLLAAYRSSDAEIMI